MNSYQILKLENGYRTSENVIIWADSQSDVEQAARRTKLYNEYVVEPIECAEDEGQTLGDWESEWTANNI